jgi:lysophospholipase L1-like esterase
MLGTNDVKPRTGKSAHNSAEGTDVLIKKIKQSFCGNKGGVPEIIIVSPVPIGKHIEQAVFNEEMGGLEGQRESEKLAELLLVKAKKYGCHFLDAALFTKTGADALHLDEGSHQRLAEELAKKVKAIL